MRYQVTEGEPFGCHNTRNFIVREVRQFSGVSAEGVNVWVSSIDGRPQCTQCSGPLQAMLSTCAHANAVRRHLKRTAHE